MRAFLVRTENLFSRRIVDEEFDICFSITASEPYISALTVYIAICTQTCCTAQKSPLLSWRALTKYWPRRLSMISIEMPAFATCCTAPASTAGCTIVQGGFPALWKNTLITPLLKRNQIRRIEFASRQLCFLKRPPAYSLCSLLSLRKFRPYHTCSRTHSDPTSELLHPPIPITRNWTQRHFRHRCGRCPSGSQWREWNLQWRVDSKQKKDM